MFSMIKRFFGHCDDVPESMQQEGGLSVELPLSALEKRQLERLLREGANLSSDRAIKAVSVFATWLHSRYQRDAGIRTPDHTLIGTMR